MPTNKPTQTTSCDTTIPCPIEFLTELLEKLVEAQIAQSDKMSAIKVQSEVSTDKIAWIKSQFTNGFRSEIKTHITAAVDDHNRICQTKLDVIVKEVQLLTDKVSTYQQPKFWAKVIVATFFAAVVTIVTVNSLYNLIHHSVSKTEIQNIEGELRKNYEQLDKNYKQSCANYEQLERNYERLINERLKEERDGRNSSTRPGQ